MSVIKESGNLLEVYLSSRDERDLLNLMMFLDGVIDKVVFSTLEKNNMEDRFDEFKNSAYLAVYTKIRGMKEYDGNDSVFYQYVRRWSVDAIYYDLKQEKKVIDNEISYEEIEESDASFERFGLLEDYIEEEMLATIDESSKMKIVARAIESLPQDQKKIIYLYFGFGEEEPKSVYDIGKIVGCSHELVRIKLLKGINKIKINIYHSNMRNAFFGEGNKITKVKTLKNHRK